MLNKSLFLTLGLGSASMLALAISAPSAHAANLLSNASFETPDASAGDVAAPNSGTGIGDWIAPAGNTFYTQAHANTGVQSGKMFGNVGLFQQIVPVSNPLDLFTATVQMFNASNDPLKGSEGGFINMDLLDANKNVIATIFGSNEGSQLTSASPQDTWLPETVAATGLPGTAFVRVDFVAGPFSGLPGAAGGAVFVDDAALTEVAVPEPASLGLLASGTTLLALRRRRTTSV
jgi:hypothetical protein